MKQLISYIPGLLIFSLLLFSACGYGGSSDTPDTIIQGTAAKGLILNGTIEVYPLAADGSEGELLASSGTDGAGDYNINIGGYIGPVVAKVYGPYLDEATGAEYEVSRESPLRAMNSNVSGRMQLAVTGITELAVRQVEAQPDGATLANIDAANQLIGQQFNLDILQALPVAAEADALAEAGEAASAYTYTLATLSQLMRNNGQSLDETLAELAADILDDGALSPATLDAYDAAATEYFETNPNNATGLSEAPQNVGEGVGRSLMVVTLNLTASAPVYSVDIEIAMPAGFDIRTAADGQPESDVLRFHPGAETEDAPFAIANYSAETASEAATITLSTVADVNGAGFGERILSIDCGVFGDRLPTARDFRLANLVAYGSSVGNTVPLDDAVATLDIAAR
jgi:hypothetical protein